MRVHPEGLEFLKGMGIVALMLLVVVLRFSPLLDPFFRFVFVDLVDRVARNFPPAELDGPTSGGKRKRGTKLTARQLRRGPTATHRRIVLFDWFTGALIVYGLADSFLIAEPYRLPTTQRWPILISVFVSGTAVLFVGLRVWDDKVGWRKWTFWAALLSTLIIAVGLVQWLQPMSLSTMLLILFVSGLTFFWSFGTLRRIDRHTLELRGLKVTGENKPADASEMARKS